MRGQSSLSASLASALIGGAASRPRAEYSGRREVLAHVVAGSEDERRRIASEIHDDSIQVMTAAGMRLQILRRSLTDPGQLARMSDVEQTIHFSIARLRHLISELRPSSTRERRAVRGDPCVHRGLSRLEWYRVRARRPAAVAAGRG